MLTQIELIGSTVSRAFIMYKFNNLPCHVPDYVMSDISIFKL